MIVIVVTVGCRARKEGENHLDEAVIGGHGGLSAQISVPLHCTWSRGRYNQSLITVYQRIAVIAGEKRLGCRHGSKNGTTGEQGFSASHAETK